MKKTARLLAGAALMLLMLLAFAAPASAQEDPGVTAPGAAASGSAAGVTTIPGPQVSPQVQGATAVAPTGALPYTGGDSLPMAQIGVALLVAGGLVTFAVRKRNSAATA